MCWNFLAVAIANYVCIQNGQTDQPQTMIGMKNLPSVA